MTRIFFGKVFYSHGVMNNEAARDYSNRAKAAGLQVICRKVSTGVEVFCK